MELLWSCLIVGFGGAVGSICRYLLGLLPVKPQNGFPLITLGINVVGAFCIGLIMALASKNPNINPYILLLLKVGFCGGFTTFSTFSLEAVGLLQNGSYFIAILYMFLSIILCISAVVGAQMLIK
ncbi:fluoride efflux transporter CrcB [Acetanaerobacterium elongatum]|uniref:Fluoride-specific ion channel FluC n=1 Tax=Acetanaerobacterium elongatum TaxID=258515 RepID=A0A1H0D8P7_9FIRM|nr:fluoride efflux transporter CrcB [Acetanaerobacterium elongatum]SDN66341.1 CrcB protein [Acetanaerobacterium elongatum]